MTITYGINTASASVNVSVNDLPTVSIDVADDICEGSDLLLFETGGEAESWAWSGPNGFLSEQQNPVIENIAPINAGTYEVTVINEEGCSNSTSVEVSIIASPSIELSAENACFGQDIQLNMESDNGIQFNWTGPNGFASDEQNPVLMDISDLDNGTYEVTVTDADNCSNTSTIDINVQNLPVIQATGNTDFCEGEALTLVEAGMDGILWSWEGPNSFSSTNQNPVIPITTLEDAGTYTVAVTGGNGCVAEMTVDVNIFDLPLLEISGNTMLPAGADLALSETGGEATSWVWEGPAAFSATTADILVTNVDSTNAGIYTVQVVNADGCTSETNIEVQVTNILALVSANSPICAGESLQFQEFGGLAVSWLWTGPNGFSSIEQNPLIENATPDNSGTYSVTILDAVNNSISASVEIEVLAAPAANVQGENPVCEGDTLNLLESGGEAVSWLWTGPEDFTSTEQNPSIENVMPSNTGTYSVIVTNENGCSQEENIDVTVNPSPVININSNSLVCEGNTLELGEDGGEAVQWLWSGPNDTGSDQQNWLLSDITLSQAGAYQLTITDVQGCINAGMISVSIEAAPVVSLSTNSPLCEGEDLELSEIGGDAVSWSWTGPGGFNVSDQITGISSVGVNASGEYTLVVTSINGCTSSAIQPVLINALPEVAFQNLEMGYCKNVDAPIVINSNQTGGSFSIEGENGLNDLGDGRAELIPQDLAVGTYSISFNYEDANACSGDTTQLMEIYPVPNVMATTESTPCSGQDFFMLTEAGGEAISWQWTGPNTFSSIEQNPDVTTSGGVEGIYEVLATDGNGCSDTATINIEFALGETFVSNFLIANAACAGDSVHMVEISETSLSPTSFFWDFGDGSTSTNRDPIHVYQNPGSYLVQVEVFDQDCGNISIQKSIDVINCRRGLLDGEDILKAKISPNPTSGLFILQVELIDKDDLTIELFDIYGRLMEERTKENIYTLKEHFTISNPGNYFMKIRAEKQRELIVLKVVVF